MQKHRKNRRKWLLLGPLLAAVFVVAIVTATQLFAHRHPYFTPDYPRQDLTELLSGKTLTGEDYETLLLQTGLGRTTVDGYLSAGEGQRILDAQEAFFRAPSVRCDDLGFVTREDHQIDAEGNLIYGVPMAPLENGDVLLSFSTHTLGWRHGHAGLVVDTSTPEGSTLEAALIGTDSVVADARHWGVYSTFVHLRLKDATQEERQAAADYALHNLNGIPYHLTSGVFGREKAPKPDSPGFGAQCAYLVWYALWQAGYDADSDGGRIVTVADLAESPLFEVVQVYGIDPRGFTD